MSPSDCITFQNSGYFTDIIVDYLNQSEKVKSLYNRFPSLENFKEQIQEKSTFPISNRAVLVESISSQYTQFNTSELTKQNIKLLAQENTFTITTGHQLNLFT